MRHRSEKRFCTLDHANKRREIAQQTPYEFWLKQVSRRDRGPAAAGGAGRPQRRTGGG